MIQGRFEMGHAKPQAVGCWHLTIDA